MKINRKSIFENIYRNRYIAILCVILILGTIFGTGLLKVLPETVCKNIYVFLSQEPNDYYSQFLNTFSLSFILLTASYLSGFSLIGKYFVPSIVFFDGTFYGFKNSIIYKYTGTEYLFQALITLILIKFFYEFLLIIISESSVYLSKSYFDKSKSHENDTFKKTHYNTRNHNVKFIAFTAILALISAVSAYFTPIIRSLI